MKIVLVGAGNLATQLGRSLAGHGYDIAQIYSRTEASAETLGAVLQVPFVTSVGEICTDADLYIVAVKDSALPELIPQLVNGREHALFVHTAGSLPMDIWKHHALRYGVFYPMQTFSKQRQVEFDSIPIFIEAQNEADCRRLKKLASVLSSKVYDADSSQRRALHLSAVFACNFTNYMYSVCEHLLAEAGLPFDTMLPLIDETAAKVHELLPSQAQTGPAVRYDTNVISKHLEALAAHPEWQELYGKISKNIYHDKLRFNSDQSTGV